MCPDLVWLRKKPLEWFGLTNDQPHGNPSKHPMLSFVNATMCSSIFKPLLPNSELKINCQNEEHSTDHSEYHICILFNLLKTTNSMRPLCKNITFLSALVRFNLSSRNVGQDPKRMHTSADQQKKQSKNLCSSSHPGPHPRRGGGGFPRIFRTLSHCGFRGCHEKRAQQKIMS